MSAVRPEPLSKVDTAWFHMDSPVNHMMVTSVLLFDEPVDEARLRRVMHARMLPFARFRQRVITPPRHFGEPEWELVEDFDLDDHVHHVALPEPGGEEELKALVGDLMSTPLDPAKPLWESHLVHGYSGGAAIVFRMHHCIADGIALTRLLLSLTDTEPDAPDDGGIPVWRRYELAARHHGNGRSRGLAGLASLGAREAMRTLRHPERGVQIVRGAVGGAAALLRVSTLPVERPALKGTLGVRKGVAWTRPIPLDEVKSVARAVRGTVNDVLVTATAGAVRRYLESHGHDVDGLVIHATVPVNLRPPSDVIELGNRFGLVYPELPVGVSDPLKRLQAVKEQMDALKASPEALVAIGMLDLMGRGPAALERAALDLFTSKSTMVLTNVPGPRTVLYYAGAPLRGIVAWAPPSGSLSMSVSIHSYAGTVTIAVAADAHVLPDPQELVDAVHAELAALAAAAPAPRRAHRTATAARKERYR